MKYATEMGSGAMMYIPSFIQIGSGIQKLIREGYTGCREGFMKYATEMGSGAMIYIPSFI
jgi:putative transposon-encoded protein